MSARVELENGTVVRRNHDQLVTRPTEGSAPEARVPFTSPQSEEARDPEFLAPNVNSLDLNHEDDEPPVGQIFQNPGQATPVRCYPVRDQKPTHYLL